MSGNGEQEGFNGSVANVSGTGDVPFMIKRSHVFEAVHLFKIKLDLNNTTASGYDDGVSGT